MYFISPPSPNIFLMCGLYDEEFLGFGEKNGKLCIYSKSIFDLGDWEEFYFTDIDVVKSDCCETGIHVATRFYDNKTILIASRENQYTRIFLLDMLTEEITCYEMLQEDNSLLHNLNLCCKCLSPLIQSISSDSDNFLFDIVPQKYQNNIVRIHVTINKSYQCTMWKNSFTLDPKPISSNILMNENGEVLSATEKANIFSFGNRKIKLLSLQSADVQLNFKVDDGWGIDWLWHELAFSTANGYCLTRRKKGDKSFLQLLHTTYSAANTFLHFENYDYCIVDANFPSLESIHFYVKFRNVDKEFHTKKGKVRFGATGGYGIPSYIYFQLANGSTVTIPLEVLSLSQSAYLSLARSSQSSQQQQRQLPIAVISNFYYYCQWIRNLCGSRNESKEIFLKEHASKKENKEDVVWMSQEFIRKKIGWPRILPLIKAPVLPTKSK